MKYLLILSLLTLSACGFAPVYGDYSTSAKSTEASTALSKVRISPLANREGQYLRNALIDRFYNNGYPETPFYQLSLSPLVERETNFDITVESETTRRQLKISTSLVFNDLRTGETILSETVYGLSSYNVLESEFATRVSEQNAREAILNDLARQIEVRISLLLNKI